MDFIKFVAPVVTKPLTVYTVVFLLILWALWSGIWLWQGAAKFRAALDKARRRLEKAPDAVAFASNFEAVRSDLGSMPVIGERWRDYCNSLIVIDRPIPMVGTTARVATWFDLGLVRSDPGRNHK